MAVQQVPKIQRSRELLNVIAVVAILDFLLLVPLFLGLVHVLDTEAYVAPLGMAHGIGFAALVLLAGKGTVEGRWGWWFPVLTVVTGGAIGSLVGDVAIRRSLQRRAGMQAVDLLDPVRSAA